MKGSCGLKKKDDCLQCFQEILAVNAPYGYFIDIHLTLFNSTDEGSAPVQLVDTLTGIIDVHSAEFAHYHFIADGGMIKLKTGHRDIRFRILLYWNEFPSLTSDFIERSVPSVYKPDSTRFPVLVTANTRVSATIVVNPVNDQDSRGVLFFDGPNWNSTCLGTGYTLMNNMTQFVSTGNSMTIIAIGHFHSAYIVLQDYENTKDIMEFQGLDCYMGKDCGDFELDGTNGPVVLQSYNPTDEYYKSEIMDVITKIEGDGKLDVYIGGRTKNGTNKIASYA
ncbi:hypothetical protein CAEBREN_16864 [Caenorhabditis brenneri]|uniref:CUB-like domain-containing protein n=1 Tax=Caenorhabditis brenneri TaxID=135651 RepID=G0NIS7_CAEBE|nr:hypothetical protein CAEBREN_16864 [Caenorhabditis brenneri]